MNKQFEEGMESASKAYEDKCKSISQEIEEILKSVCEQMENFKEVQDEIVDIAEEHDEKINQHQKEILELRNIVKYNLRESLTVDMLDEMEKEVLAGIMIKLTKNMDLNAVQQFYCNALLRYIGLTTANIIMDLDAIEELEDLNKQKIVLQSLMELMFLNDNSFNFLEDFDNVTSYFSISAKGIKALKDNISSINNTFGFMMIIGRYYIPETNVNFEHNLEEVEEEVQPLDVRSDYIIDNYLSIEKGQTLKLRNKNIIIKDFIYIKGGVLDIKHCTINFNSDSPLVIKLSNDGILKLTNSAVIMTRVPTSYVIQSNDGTILFDTVSFSECVSLAEEKILDSEFYRDTNFSFVMANDTIISVSNSNFVKCKNYMFKIENNCKVNFSGCLISRHLGGFIYSTESRNSELIFLNMTIMKCKARRDFELDYFLVGGAEKTVFRNCSIDAEDVNNNLKFLKINIVFSTVLLERCMINNLPNKEIGLSTGAEVEVAHSAYILIESFNTKLSVEHCIFENTGGIKLGGICGSSEVSVENTTFTNCSGTLISAGRMTLNNCTFTDCRISKSSWKESIVPESILSMLGESDSIVFLSVSEEEKHSNIKNCIFTRCKSKAGIIKIRCNAGLAKELKVGTISNCKFNDCTYNYVNGLIDGTVDNMGKDKKEIFTYYYDTNNTITGQKIDIENEMFKIVERNLVHSKNSSYVETYIGPFMSDDKIEKAIKKLAPTIKQEDVLALIDTSLFNNGEDGLIISKKGFHFPEINSEPRFISYYSIIICYMERELKPLESTLIFELKDFTIISMNDTGIYKPTLISIIQKIQQLINN